MNPLDNLLASLRGKKTYLAAAGFLGLAVYQFSIGDVPGAVSAALMAATGFGLRNALPPTPPPPAVPPAQTQPVVIQFPQQPQQ